MPNRTTEPRPRWIWQQPDWPGFHWQADALAALL
ncbi:hypothetical protein DB813_14265, partial [Xanthomonas perforans]